jgi:VWFA-related protein
MRKRCPAVGSLLFSIALANSVSAQEPPPLQQPIPSGAGSNTYTLQLKAQSVVLDIVVTNSKGEVVPNLIRDDFQVYEDKAPQIVRSLEPPPSHAASTNPPIHSTAELDRVEPNVPVTLIVLDEINTRFEDEAFARYSVKKFLDKQGDTLEQPTLLGAVDMDHFTLLSDYTTSKQELLSALERHLVAYPWHMEGTSWKAEQFNASFAALMEIAEATTGHAGHKSLLWIGRGFPPFDPTTLTQQANDGLKQVIEACINALQTSRVALYTLDPAGVSLDPEEMDAEGFAEDPFAGQVDFNLMARATGGHAFFGRNDVDKLVETSARDGASFYTLSYTPIIPGTDTQAFHSIRVVMKNPDLRAETREGYYSHVPQPFPVASIGGKQPNRQVFDLAVAAQSMMVYDALHMTVKRVGETPDQFKISLNSADLVWHESGTQKLITTITVVVGTFDKNGTALDRSVKISTLQVGEGSSANTPDAATVNLFTSIPTKSPAARVRFLVRVDANQRLGAVNFVLGDENPAGEVSN